MDVHVNTRSGTLCGEQQEGFIQFLGVPYARPPVGELRFRRPQPMEGWSGIREAKSYGNYCIQPGLVDTIAEDAKGSEDCLTLNIYTPACDGKRRPVAIWIHGGAYLTGCHSSSTKRGGRMCQTSDIVVVAIQYRLGALGHVNFASLSGANGRFDTNCGTWDQVAAVEWVIENIAEFGGDPECITLMGESAGADSVLTLITTPYLKGKIRRAVLESASALLIQTPENGRLAALDVINRLGIPEEEAYKIAELPAEVLTKAVEESENNYVNYRPYTIPTAPVVDGDLIPILPFDAIMQGAADGIEMLIGTTKDEGTLFARGSAQDLFPSSEKQLDLFIADHPQIEREAILALYPDYPSMTAFQEIGKEIFFHLPSVELAYHLATVGKVYLYQFDYIFPTLKKFGVGAGHCSNSFLTAGLKLTENYPFFNESSDQSELIVPERIHHYWCSFIATGNPNGHDEPYWQECGEEKNTMFIDMECHMEQSPFEKERRIYGLIRPYGN